MGSEMCIRDSIKGACGQQKLGRQWTVSRVLGTLKTDERRREKRKVNSVGAALGLLMPRALLCSRSLDPRSLEYSCAPHLFRTWYTNMLEKLTAVLKPLMKFLAGTGIFSDCILSTHMNVPSSSISQQP